MNAAKSTCYKNKTKATTLGFCPALEPVKLSPPKPKDMGVETPFAADDARPDR
jgi:hypothetical protein